MSKGWIVSKFGGSSVKDAQAMLRCCQIIESNPLIKMVVISATQNTTNQLEFIAQAGARGDESTMQRLVDELVSRHLHIAKELFTSPKVIEEFEFLAGELKALGEQILQDRNFSSRTMDELYSLGERISSLLVSDLLRLRLPGKNIIFLDARKIIKTNSDYQKAVPQIDIIAENAKTEIIPYLSEKTIFVTQGFIGSDLLGFTTTLGREGSDYSAALLGEAIDASLVQIWTDVEGVASSDPRIVSDVYFLDSLSYDEATALATLGAKVLFPTTLMPAKRKNIPVFVGSSLNPEIGGTIITHEKDPQFKLKAVSATNESGTIILSFVGTHLNERSSLPDKLLAELDSHFFELIDFTPHSVSYKLISPKFDYSQVLRLGHKILLSYRE